ncbi:MAG: thymidylate synthase [bacterium]|nr:thymidylate synthase [bacterium]
MTNNTQHPEYQYLNLMREILEHGDKQIDEHTEAVTWSLFGRQIRFDLEKDGFPLLTTKKVYWKGVLQELYWFFSGQNNIKYLVDNNVHIWDDYPYKLYLEKIESGANKKLEKEEFIEKISQDEVFAKEHGTLRYIYGELWRAWPTQDGRTIDQLSWALNEVKRDPACHNAVVTSWNPEYLYKMATPEKASRFPICHNMFQFNVKDGRLCLQLYQRSADIFLGVPFNIGSYALLLAVAAKITGYKPGEFVHTFGDVHIYDNHKEAALLQLEREPRPFPKVSISDETKDINSFVPEHATLEGYDPHPAIKGDLTVSGGVVTEAHKKFVKSLN